MNVKNLKQGNSPLGFIQHEYTKKTKLLSDEMAGLTDEMEKLEERMLKLSHESGILLNEYQDFIEEYLESQEV